MNIVFLNPCLSHRELYGEWDLSDVKSYSTPLGILYLAASARQNGHHVFLVDAQAQGLDLSGTVQQVKGLNPAIVAITAMTISIHRAAEFSQALKKALPLVKIVIGGSHLTALPLETMQAFPTFDFGIIGEGERSFIELLNRMKAQTEISDIKGLVLRKGDGVVINQRQEFIEDLDSLPLPAWDLVQDIPSHYKLSIFGTRQQRSMGLVTSRGCPGQCIFCDTGVFGHRFRCHSADYVLKMITWLYKQYHIRDFLFYDDLFIGNKKRLLEICELLKKNNLKISWSCCARVDFVNPELLKLMHDSGCWMIEYGIESATQEILDFLKKNIKIEQIKNAIAWTRKARIIAKGNFIFGSPLETKETLRQSIDLAINLKLDYFQHTFMTPLPGSKIYEIADKYGLFKKDWRNTNTIRVNFVPCGLTAQELRYFSKMAWRKFYLRPGVVAKEFSKIRNLQGFINLIVAIKAFLKSALFRY
jgi:radical SAM superfamily enzyme YgiQ (UPF0313 family)